MIENIKNISELTGLFKVKNRIYDLKSVHPKLVEEFKAKGWEIQKQNKNSTRIRKNKVHSILFEDRVWSLLYKLGFNFLNDEGGAIISVTENNKTINNQIDVVGIDREVAIAIECKSSITSSKRAQFQEELGKFSMRREAFTRDIRKQFPEDFKKQVVMMMFLSNSSISENDVERAKNANILLFDDKDLLYYESLVSQIGIAAKYQFFADMLPGKNIPGLEIKIPAIKTKMGGTNCFSFSISPEYLLKISFVSHRAKGKQSDITTYQRMLSKSRLKKIKEYITENGIFPTNIVLNIDSNRLTFQKVRQDSDTDVENGILGWLDIKPSYKSAWIIDGQHRLYSYSGHEKASKSKLSVLAFEGLTPSKQAELFIDINAKQKSVKQSLLEELFAELHWDAEDPKERVSAIISKAIQDMNIEKGSPLQDRIKISDTTEKNPLRCLTLTSLFGEIEKKGFHIAKIKAGDVLEYGPLWAGEDNFKTLKRTEYVLNNWLSTIKNKVNNWWDKGSAEGGGIAMNDGIATCIQVLRNIFDHLEKSGKKLIHLSNEELSDLIMPYGEVLGEYFASFNEDERKRFRELRGVQGVTTRVKRSQQAIHQKIKSFNPEGLQEFIATEKAQTNKKAKEIIDDIEIKLQKFILSELKREFGDDENEWWMLGVPLEIRKRVSERFEEEGGKRGGRENYFDLIHYRKIILDNWTIFEKVLGHEKEGRSKDAKTSWLNFINEKRKVVSHPTSAVIISLEDLAKVEDYGSWLNMQIDNSNSSSD